MDGAGMEAEGSAGKHVRAATEGCLLWIWKLPENLGSQWHFGLAPSRQTESHTGMFTIDVHNYMKIQDYPEDKGERASHYYF